MSYFRADTPTPIDDLLTKVEVAEAEDLNSDPLDLDIPTLEQFLKEEDFLKECRTENTKLVEYLCRKENIDQLVDKAFTAPSSTPIPTDSNGHLSEDISSAAAEKDYIKKIAYVSSEVLASDTKRISEALISNSSAMEKILTVLDQVKPGHLDNGVALHFSKIIISLMKMQNSQVISLMNARASHFISSILHHIGSVPIAELIVRMLDSPEPDDTYPTTVRKKPTSVSLLLLSSTDLLGGLAEGFVRVCNVNPLNSTINIQDQNDNEQRENRTQNLSDDIHEHNTEDAHFQHSRLREETMSNVIMTILGITERILQLPELGVHIPDSLNIYKSSEPISRLLDAGLYATNEGSLAKGHAQVSALYTGSTQERIEAFINGNSSPLINALGLAADLMTTEANIVRDDQDDSNAGLDPVSRQGYSGVSKTMYTGTGIAASMGAATSQTESDSDSSNVKSTATLEYQSKKVGDKIVETDQMESQLALRFPRLARMFGEKEVIDENGVRRPLGSLRLRLAEFFTACMKMTNDDTIDQIINLNIPKKLLELFEVYQWSSMLHVVITRSIMWAFESHDKGNPARRAWLQSGLIPWLIDSWNSNTRAEESNTGQSRAGYMGHLIRIGTALKGYIDEVESDSYNNKRPMSDLPSQDELTRFNIFAEEVLAPAHHLELTPLCDEQLGGHMDDDDEIEEATDVLDMDGIGIIGPESVARENVNLRYSSLRGNDDLDDDEEIQPVEVDDLDHFGVEDDDPNVRHIIDHDIPPALRDQMEKDEKEAKNHSSAIEINTSSNSNNHNSTSSTAAIPIVDQRSLQPDDLRGIIDTVDSSSDDEGSYEAFVDDQNALESANISSAIGVLETDSNDVSSNSLDGVVTEIEEPESEVALNEITSGISSNIVIDAGESSDEEYEEWTDPAKEVSEIPHIEETSSATSPVTEEQQEKNEEQQQRQQSVA